MDKSGMVMVETPFGKDYIMSMHDKGEMTIELPDGKEALSGHFAAASVQNGKIAWMEAIN
ncbi:hypothetical protein ADICYQ_5218 [Cyclobacterium qasimii M12-11B]|nr:hypothetical protein ADICYQ_5218 [Cyclobacterium qasimii M12-11B]